MYNELLEIKEKMKRLYNMVAEIEKRMYAAIEAKKLQHGGNVQINPFRLLDIRHVMEPDPCSIMFCFTNISCWVKTSYLLFSSCIIWQI